VSRKVLTRERETDRQTERETERNKWSNREHYQISKSKKNELSFILNSCRVWAFTSSCDSRFHNAMAETVKKLSL
jgi:hypothetical protein